MSETPAPFFQPEDDGVYLVEFMTKARAQKLVDSLRDKVDDPTQEYVMLHMFADWAAVDTLNESRVK